MLIDIRPLRRWVPVTCSVTVAGGIPGHWLRHTGVYALVLILCLGPVSAALAAPRIQNWETSNGARVYFVPAPELPMVDVRVVFDAGSARDDGNAGLALLTNKMLDQGAGEMDADAIAERFDSLGARFSSSALRDMAVLHLRSLSDPELLAPALETMALVLARPTFPAKAFERERERLLIGLRQQQQSPSEVAEKAFYRAVYRGHPYATPPQGTEQGVKNIKPADLVAFHGRYYTARNAVVAIVGDLDRDQATALAERLVGGLPAGEVASVMMSPQPLVTADSVSLQHPSTQTHIRVGAPGMRRGDPDYFPLYVGNHILGGSGLVSRLSEEIREQRGLSYSVYSYFLPMRVDGPFILGLQTRNEQTGEALSVLRQTLSRFVTEGPTAEELTAAKQNITGGFPLRIDSNQKITEYIAMIGFYGLPLDYLETFTERVSAVTADQIRDAFRRRVHPQRMVTVIVGGTPEPFDSSDEPDQAGLRPQRQDMTGNRG